jgi:hypothetical protein
MMRWVAQTHQNYVSVTPYNWTASMIHGFQATRQPAIWMGESGPVVIVPGVSRGEEYVKTDFEERAMKMRKETEVITPSYCSIVLEDALGGEILVEQSASKSWLFSRKGKTLTNLLTNIASRVGHLRFTFTPSNPETDTPCIVLESSRPSVLTSTPANISFPHDSIDPFAIFS